MVSTDTIGDVDDPALTLDSFVPFRLSVASNAVSEAVARVYRALFNLSITEWRLVAVLAETSGLSQQAIGARTRMDKVSVSRAAIALARRGLISRSGDPADGRAYLLRLTEDGRTLYAAVAPKARAIERQLFAGFGDAELAALTAMLRRVEGAALALLDDRADQPPSAGTGP